MDIDSALKVADGEDIRNRCHVNSNEDGDRFVLVLLIRLYGTNNFMRSIMC